MYDRPNAIKGRYVKIPNMLIFVAEPVNHEVIDLWRLFNIIYIMRTNDVVANRTLSTRRLSFSFTRYHTSCSNTA